MAVPKRKTSKAKIGSRRGSHKRKLPAVSECSQCGSAAQPHRVCPECGFYNGRQVLTVSVDD